MSSYERGGITRAHEEVFKELSKSETVDLLCFQNLIPDAPEKVKFLTNSRASSPLFKIPTAIKRLLALTKYITEYKPSILICSDPSTALLGWICSKMFEDIRVIGSCHVPIALMNKQDKFIIRSLYSRLFEVVVPSRLLEQDILSLNDRVRVNVIPNMLPIASCQCDWPRKMQYQSTFLFFGRFSHEKNPEHVLQMALKDARSKYLLCGEGAELPILTAFCNINEIGNVRFEPYQPSSSVMPRVSLLIIPSLKESFGIAAIEAWIQGIPVLASSEAEGITQLMKVVGIEDADISLSRGIEDWIFKAHHLANAPLHAGTSLKVLELFHPSEIIKKWVDLISS